MLILKEHAQLERGPGACIRSGDRLLLQKAWVQHRRPSDDFDLRSREDHQIARAYVVAARDLVPLSESVSVFPHLWTPSVLGTALLYEMGVIDEPLPPEEAPGFVLKNLFRIAFQCVLAASSTQHYKRAPGGSFDGAQAGVHGGAPLLRGELTPMPDFPQGPTRAPPRPRPPP
eukprot:tig00000525_g1957.t1